MKIPQVVIVRKMIDYQNTVLCQDTTVRRVLTTKYLPNVQLLQQGWLKITNIVKVSILIFFKGLPVRRSPQSVGCILFGRLRTRARSFFKMQTSKIVLKKVSFLKITMYLHRQERERGLKQCGHFADKGDGVDFCNFVRASFMDSLYKLILLALIILYSATYFNILCTILEILPSQVLSMFFCTMKCY